ncbi:nitroreductase family deazaflavin-dependent oxidoreductase [Mycobacterium sp. E1386]|uniref:nitroreductase family deazaflavin-dependent oxidoreductase n=1 Tax=Mycobacterium sp. E1386 TaxID=1834126 RepID=UPI000A6423D9|nr:nitroreductase family deazaflavin-dependent oxidoreductase [Mycobacterium sp. E1386]
MVLDNRSVGRALGRGLVGVMLVALVWLVLVPRVFRRHRDLMLKVGPFRGFLRRYNDATRKISGTKRSSWALLTHVGRRSGRVYQTSLGAIPYRDGFLLPLGYGPHTDWYRNLMAAGACTLAYKGQAYWLERPELVSCPDVMRAWPARSRILLQLAGIHDFVWLHLSREQRAESAPLASQVDHAAN